MFALQTCLPYITYIEIKRFEAKRSKIMETEQNQVPQNNEKLKEIPFVIAFD